jgi:glucose/arabinose dehydrogenase
MWSPKNLASGEREGLGPVCGMYATRLGWGEQANARRMKLHAIRPSRRQHVKARPGVLIAAEINRIVSFVKRSLSFRHGVLFALLLPLVQLALQADVLAAEPPLGFNDSAVVTVYGEPTDLSWLGDDMLIATENGWLFRQESTSAPDSPLGTAQMILDLSSQVGQGPEQGLLGVVADPDFPARPYIYVFYTRARESGHCLDFPANCSNRVSRFTMGDDGLLDPASEQPLLDSILVGSLHNAGDLAFDAENLLYVSTGDAGRWKNSQDLSNLNGKILRVTRDGTPAPGNPFNAPGALACNGRKPGASASTCPEIFAYGLRNPFRIAFNPNEETPIFYINDVGQEGWEEINLGIAGANYGWPLREGPCPIEMSLPCEPDAGLVEPIYTYAHETGCFAITGGAFVPNWSPWGAAFHNKYLFADWGCGRIFVLSPGENGNLVASPLAEDIPTVTALLFSRDGVALYYAYEGGEEGGRVGAIWSCPGHPLYGLWPPSCTWGSRGSSTPGGE